MKRNTDVKEGVLVVVTWGDAWARADFYERGLDYTPMVVKNVGWVCEENDKTIVLYNSINQSGFERGLTIIPWCNVIKIEELES